MAAPQTPHGLALDLSGERGSVLEMNPVSRETAGRLDRFVDTLLRWQRITNLVAPSTLATLWTRHIADSLQLLSIAPSARVWVDFGSGGGFPGLVLACALADTPGALVHLVESNARKAAFLRQAVRAAGAAAIVHTRRAEVFGRTFKGQADMVTARALAGLPELVALAAPLLERGAQALFLKGQDVDAELTEAAKYWNMDVTLIPSKTDSQGRIVHIRAAERRDSA